MHGFQTLVAAQAAKKGVGSLKMVLFSFPHGLGFLQGRMAAENTSMTEFILAGLTDQPGLQIPLFLLFLLSCPTCMVLVVNHHALPVGILVGQQNNPGDSPKFLSCSSLPRHVAAPLFFYIISITQQKL